MVLRRRDKAALISGAARGIGLAIAQAFVAEDAAGWLSDIDVEAGERATAALGSSARFLRLDVRDEADWRSAWTPSWPAMAASPG